MPNRCAPRLPAYQHTRCTCRGQVEAPGQAAVGRAGRNHMGSRIKTRRLPCLAGTFPLPADKDAADEAAQPNRTARESWLPLRVALTWTSASLLPRLSAPSWSSSERRVSTRRREMAVRVSDRARRASGCASCTACISSSTAPALLHRGRRGGWRVKREKDAYGGKETPRCLRLGSTEAHDLGNETVSGKCTYAASLTQHRF